MVNKDQEWRESLCVCVRERVMDGKQEPFLNSWEVIWVEKILLFLGGEMIRHGRRIGTTAMRKKILVVPWGHGPSKEKTWHSRGRRFALNERETQKPNSGTGGQRIDR